MTEDSLWAENVPAMRFSQPSTFGRVERGSAASPGDVAIVGVPFDSGTTNRPGARFGPAAIREASSRPLRSVWHPQFNLEPFGAQDVRDLGDIAATPFDIPLALRQIEGAVSDTIVGGAKVVALGGDHTISLPLLRATAKRYGPVALLHFDAHLDTADHSVFGARFTHATPFRRAAEEELVDPSRSAHVGINRRVYGRDVQDADVELGYLTIENFEVQCHGIDAIGQSLLDRLGGGRVYISVDIDVLDVAFAPGTGTPESGGLASWQLLELLGSLAGADVVGADVVEVAPAYDHSGITSVAAAAVTAQLVGLMAVGRRTAAQWDSATTQADS